jgi:ProP effector
MSNEIPDETPRNETDATLPLAEGDAAPTGAEVVVEVADAAATAEPAVAAQAEGAAPADDTPAAAAPDTQGVAPASAATTAVPELSPAAVGARLAELFPALFKPGQAKPLKLRIQTDIQQRAPGSFTKKSLSMFLHRYTMSTPYLIALTRSDARIDLDGQPAGELAAEHRDAATTELARRRTLHEARRAAENSARRDAEAQARQLHAAENDARRERAALLRAFETTTLTRGNFCALKRIDENTLEAALATARLEREQRPPEAMHEPRPDRRPPDMRPRGANPNERQGRPGHPEGPGRPDRQDRQDRPRGRAPNRPAPR